MEWLRISTSTELVRVQTDDIVFVHADGNYSEVLLYNGKKHTMTFQLHFFDETFQRLKNNFFVRVGRSLIVNKNYIYLINLTEQRMILTGGKLDGEYEVKASKEALKELKVQLEAEQLPSWQKGGTE
ncbi:MAG: LytTR family DNA-binding domain-containing protein [Prevotellaceae bacterium]|nr:LytTR family DNA-binding domain-containing protein [Prevotellaceae bacterium]